MANIHHSQRAFFMKKHYMIGGLFLVVGIIGLLVCIGKQQFYDTGKYYKKSWQLSHHELTELTVKSSKDVTVHLERSSGKHIVITASGNLSAKEKNDVKRIVPHAGKFSLTIGTPHHWLEKWHRPLYTSQKVIVQLPKGVELSKTALELKKGNIRIDQVTGEQLDVKIKSGDIQGNKGAFKTTRIDAENAQVDLTEWHGTTMLSSETGNQIVKDSTGDLTLQNQVGMSQVHRHHGEKSEIFNMAGKIVATESNIRKLIVNSIKGTAIIEGLQGKLLLNTNDGKSVLRDNLGSQIVRSKNGDVIIAQSQKGKMLDIASESGLIKLTLNPVYQQARLKIHAPHGHIASDLLWSKNAKQPVINLRTKDGEIKVLEKNK